MVQKKLKVSESRACRVIGQHRSTQHYQIKKLPDEDSLSQRIIELACKYGTPEYLRSDNGS